MMLSKMKKRSFKKIALAAAILLVGFGVCLFLSGLGVLKFIMGPRSLDELSADQLEGQYVTAELQMFLDEYAYTESLKSNQPRGKVTEREYVLPVGEQEFIGVAVDRKNLAAAEDIMDASYKALTGEETDAPEPLRVTGTILPMDAETRSFYEASYVYELLEDASDLMLPLVLRVGYVGSERAPMMWSFTALSLACLAGALWMLISALTGRYQKQITNFCKVSGSPESTLEKLDMLYERTEPCNGICLSGEYLMVEKGPKNMVFHAPDVVWAYQRTVRHRTNGIPTGKTFGLVFRTVDGKCHEVAMNSENKVQETIERISREMPHTVLGYSAELEQRYRKDPSAFVRTPQQ